MAVDKDGMFAKFGSLLTHSGSLALLMALLLAATYYSWRTQVYTEEKRKLLRRKRKDELAGSKKDVDSLLNEMVTSDAAPPPPNAAAARATSMTSKDGAGGEAKAAAPPPPPAAASGGSSGVSGGDVAKPKGEAEEAEDSTPRLRWNQTREEVEVAFRVGEEIVKADVHVSVKKSMFSLKIKEQTIIAGELWANVDADVCNWQFNKKGANREVVIQLEKCEEKAWRGLLKGAADAKT